MKKLRKRAAPPPKITVALCGNPNSGKTTLFNLLTGANQKVGNWPGVTVEQKIGRYRQDATVQIVDTPGVYSLSPFAADEQVTLNFLHTRPDAIINVVDSTNLERNLFLTTQLLDLNIPVIAALNMQDEAAKKGIAVDAAKLQETFGCKFVPISAAKNTGVAELMHHCAQLAHAAPAQHVTKPASTPRTAHATSTAEAATATADLSGNNTQTVEERYEKISRAVQSAQKQTVTYREQHAATLTQKIDAVVLNKWLAFPIFAAVMAAIFFLSIDGLGGFLTALINRRLTPWLQTVANSWFEGVRVEWLRSLVVEGIIGGVMGVVGFLPQIMLLFGFIAALEASGYMSRIAFITDRLLNKIGLGGRSFVSMVLGCGCSVPAIMATRTIKNAKERNATVTLTPFMPCSAKLAVISFFTSYVFGGRAVVAISFYFLSIAAVILGGLAIKFVRRNKQDASDAFIMELPTYRAPTIGNVSRQMWERGKAFLLKAGTVIFAASVILWLLTNFNLKMQPTDAENSILAAFGKLIAPLFYPLGWNDGGCGWKYAIATVSGIAAKETVVTTLEILLPQGLGGSISTVGAYSFVAYNLLTVPCIAAISASFSEQGWKSGCKSALFQIGTAYTVALTVYHTGSFVEAYPTQCAVTACLLLLFAAMWFAAKHALRLRCAGCQGCACAQSCKNGANTACSAKQK